MKKSIVFPCTARPHLARQQLLLKELKKHFDVDVWEPRSEDRGSMSVSAIMYAVEFNNYLQGKEHSAVLIRGDRYEMLGLAMVACYRGIPITHLEGGDESGVVDNKVRHAISSISDYHFCTNQSALVRLVNKGISPNRVWNYGSLDVEYALTVPNKRIRKDKYILVAYHPIEGEDEKEVTKALKDFGYEIVNIASNKDYGRTYGQENYNPEDYINLLRYASVCVGNSSSLLKEASVLKVGVVNIGERQQNRLKPKNVIDTPCEAKRIANAIKFQLKNKHEPDYVYYQKDTSKLITKKLKELL